MEQLWTINTLPRAEAFLAQSQTTKVVVENYIGGQFMKSRDQQQFIDSFEPKTGRKYAEVPISSAQDVQEAVDAAAAAFTSWSRTTRQVRSKYLQRIAAIIQDNRELFAVWESIDQGKTLDRARVEVDRAVSNFLYSNVPPNAPRPCCC